MPGPLVAVACYHLVAPSGLGFGGPLAKLLAVQGKRSFGVLDWLVP
jgi:hypothetical protein